MRARWSRCDRLDVRAHHPLDAASAGRAVELFHGEAPLPPGVPKRFQRDVDAYAVTCLEQVGQRLGDAVNPYPLPFDLVNLDPLVKRGTAELHDAEAGVQEPWRAAAPLDGQPNLDWKLRADAMKAQCRQEADDGARCRRGSEDQAVMLGDLGAGEAIAPRAIRSSVPSATRRVSWWL